MHRTTMLALLALAGVGMAATPLLAASGDQGFATKAAQGGLAEVQMGQLAQQKAASPQVKQFGRTLAQDHAQANQQLQQIAGQESIALPTRPGHEEISEKQKLAGLSGAAFDRQFVQNEIKDHRQDIAMFEREARTGKDGQLKDFAGKSLPVLRKHLQMAESLAGANQ